ncbi:hypothetical protein LOK49_LG13G00911 [Camellia lanceoleosa]|uniref:Uncharacterized protein n=1 Tax=Camellia lanceoleosa TaxID=1840588 RepID=A0ACC0FKX8_9ERIC|nr:hypothetical protein LOK49_LG13G00911 [Camellia lanceoleosa]
MAKHSENLDLGKERERDEDPTTTGQNLLEFEDGDSPGELKNLELVVKDYLAESNECSSSMKTSENVYVEAGQISIVDLSEMERIRPTTDSGLSEREVADSAGNPALSSSEKVSEDTYIRRQESSSNSCLKQQRRLMEVCTQNTDIDEIRALMMVEGTPLSNSVKLQSDSDDIHKGDDYDLVSRSQIQSGDFDHKTLVNLKPVEDQDKVGNVVIIELTFGADGFSPVRQEEHVEDDLKTLFATPDNNTNPGEEAASSHEPEMDDLRMQEGSTIGNMKNGRNASPTANEEKVTGEGPDESAYGEFTKVNGTAFEGFVSKESYVGEDKQSESLNFSGNASEGGTTEKVLELVGNEFIAESHVVDASIDCQCSEATIPHTAHFAPEYQASGTSDKEMSSSELRLSIDNAVQDEGLTETPCKESEVSEEKIMVEFIKSSSKCIDKTNMLKEEETEVDLTSFGQLGITITEADFKDRDNVLMENVNSVVPEHDEVKHNDYNIDKKWSGCRTGERHFY